MVRLLLIMVGLCVWPALAWADAIQIQTLTKVPAGQRPKLSLRAQQAVGHVQIVLDVEGGETRSEDLGNLEAGAVREVLLDGAPGPHHYTGHISFVASDGVTQSSPLALDTLVGALLDVQIERSQVNLAAGRLPLRVSVPDGNVELRFVDGAGETLFEHEQEFRAHDPATWLVVTWPALPKGSEVGRVDVKVSDTSGAFRSFALFPWSVYIPHEEVNFATAAATIAPAEVPKLQASLTRIVDALAKHKDLGAIKLYVAGHTDTVGSTAYNLTLSRKRAQAIAGWFRKGGLSLPIAFEGFGEHAPLIATPDNKDEPRNRRVDYILSIEDPVLKATAFVPAWKLID